MIRTICCLRCFSILNGLLIKMFKGITSSIIEIIGIVEGDFLRSIIKQIIIIINGINGKNKIKIVKNKIVANINLIHLIILHLIDWSILRSILRISTLLQRVQKWE